MLYEDRFSHFRTSAKVDILARNVKLNEVYGFSTIEQDIEKQCKSRIREAVVVDSFLKLKSYPEA